MLTHRTHHHRVLVVGPWRGRAAGSGCCSGDPEAVLGRPDGHQHAARPSPERIAAADLVRALRQHAGPDVDVQLVDPRNTAFLTTAVYRDARRTGIGFVEAVRQTMRATTPWALIVDGVVVTRGEPLTVAAALRFLPQD